MITLPMFQNPKISTVLSSTWLKTNPKGHTCPVSEGWGEMYSFCWYIEITFLFIVIIKFIVLKMRSFSLTQPYFHPKAIHQGHQILPENHKYPEDIECVLVSECPDKGSIFISNVEAAQNVNTLRSKTVAIQNTKSKLCSPVREATIRISLNHIWKCISIFHLMIRKPAIYLGTSTKLQIISAMGSKKLM